MITDLLVSTHPVVPRRKPGITERKNTMAIHNSYGLTRLNRSSQRQFNAVWKSCDHGVPNRKLSCLIRLIVGFSKILHSIYLKKDGGKSNKVNERKNKYKRNTQILCGGTSESAILQLKGFFVLINQPIARSLTYHPPS